jgi:hypothetical protein
MNDSVSQPSSDVARGQVPHEEISFRAQQLWESLGRPADRDVEIWLRAERELQTAPAPATPAPSIVPDRIANVDVQALPPKAAAQPRKRGGTRAAAR